MDPIKSLPTSQYTEKAYPPLVSSVTATPKFLQSQIRAASAAAPDDRMQIDRPAEEPPKGSVSPKSRPAWMGVYNPVSENNKARYTKRRNYFS